jgi:hypothetical protein
MPYAITHYFPDGTQEQYEATLAAVHPATTTLPKGQIFHAAGASPGGWTILAVHDSRQSWEDFRDGTLVPRMRQGIEGGFDKPPEEIGFETHTVLP